MKKYMVSDKSAGYGGRVPKYRHRFCNTEFGSLKLSPQELGVICVLLLRGPQTPGELRTRTHRLCEFPGVEAVESTLQGLMAREEGPFVARLPRAAGERESRYTHLFFGPVESAPFDDEATAVLPAVGAAAGGGPGAVGAGPGAASLAQRVAQLEESVAELRRDLEALKSGR
jgi:hypothetical protein